MDKSTRFNNKYCSCGNFLFPVDQVTNRTTGGAPTILEKIGRDLATDSDIDFTAIKNKYRLDQIDLLSILRTDWYMNVAEPQERESVYNNVYNMLSPEERAKTDELKQLQNPTIIEHSYWRECAVGHNRQPLEEGSLFRESSTDSKQRCVKEQYSYGIFMDQTLERTNNFICSRNDQCGANVKEVREYWENIPYSGKAIKYIRNDYQVEYLCTYCEILAYLNHTKLQTVETLCEPLEECEDKMKQPRCKKCT